MSRTSAPYRGHTAQTEASSWAWEGGDRPWLNWRRCVKACERACPSSTYSGCRSPGQGGGGPGPGALRDGVRASRGMRPYRQLQHPGNAARNPGRPLPRRGPHGPRPRRWRGSGHGANRHRSRRGASGGLCHDVGKPYEFSPRNIERWQADPGAVGFPSVRHPGYGVHLALTVGLPEAIVHIVGAHSMNAEGQFVQPSLENVLIQYADYAFWKILAQANLMET